MFYILSGPESYDNIITVHTRTVIPGFEQKKIKVQNMNSRD